MKKILIANRGEIALRVIRTCREMGIITLGVASEADMRGAHARALDHCVCIGPAPAAESYLLGDKIIQVALEHGADAIHPGFGFLSENAGFAKAVRQAGLAFIGPSHDAIELMGSKRLSKEKVAAGGVPTIPGYSGADQDAKVLIAEAEKIGYPLLIKASAGGGGKGMRVVHEASAFESALVTAKREAAAAFGDDTMLLEKYLTNPRHIEFQIFGDTHGNLVHLFERECSIQRRHQKIIEETPSTVLDDVLRAEMAQAAITAARSVNYFNAGTVEFIFDQSGKFYFLEMNTRLQVEHPITEMLTGLDLVRWQIMVARGERLPLSQDQITRRGHAMEARIYAEDPARNFFPQTGRIIRYREPQGPGIRVDSGLGEGDEVSVYYDPMVAKLITRGADREEARQRMCNALAEFCLHGVRNNISFLRKIFRDEDFIAGNTTTHFLEGKGNAFEDKQEQLDQALALTGLASSGAGGVQAGEATPSLVDPWSQLRGWRILQ